MPNKVKHEYKVHTSPTLKRRIGERRAGDASKRLVKESVVKKAADMNKTRLNACCITHDRLLGLIKETVDSTSPIYQDLSRLEIFEACSCEAMIGTLRERADDIENLSKKQFSEQTGNLVKLQDATIYTMQKLKQPSYVSARAK